MKKLIMSVMIAAVFIASVFGASAEDEFTFNPPKLEKTKAAVTISGKYNKDMSLNIAIIKDGADFENYESVGSKLFAADDIKCGDDGVFEVSYNINDTAEEGKYLVYCGYGTQIKSDCFWHINDTRRNDWYTSIKNFSDANSLNGYLFNENDIFGDGNKYSLAEIMGITNGDGKHNAFVAEFTVNSKSDYNSYDELLSVFALSDRVYKIKDKQGTERVFNDVLLEHNIKYAKMIKIFNEVLSDDAANKVMINLSEDDLTSTEKFMTAFTKRCACAAVSGAKTNGYGHIHDIIISADNIIDMNISGYKALSPSNQNKVCMQLYNNGVSSFDDMCNKIRSYSSSANNQPAVRPGGGGTGSSSGNKSFINTAPGQTNETKREFSDIEGFDWAKEAIIYLYDKNIINGMGNNKFEPQESVTREQFLKMLMLALDKKTVSGNISFTDTDNSQWYAPYIYTAVTMGIVNGRSDNTFGIGEYITREDCAALMSRTAGITGNEAEVSFKDLNSISEYALGAIAGLCGEKIITGDGNGYFNPKDFCTRAQVAVMIYRLMNN